MCAIIIKNKTNPSFWAQNTRSMLVDPQQRRGREIMRPRPPSKWPASVGRNKMEISGATYHDGVDFMSRSWKRSIRTRHFGYRRPANHGKRTTHGWERRRKKRTIFFCPFQLRIRSRNRVWHSCLEFLN